MTENYGVSVDKVKVIENFYDGEEIRRLGRSSPEINLPERFLVAVGRLVPNKNFSLLIAAIARDPLRHVVILGDGPERSGLMHQALALGISARVHFAGFQKNPFAIVSRAEAFVSTSNAEGFPNSMVEAMALGVPVIASDCESGPSEILADQDAGQTRDVFVAPFGILFPVNNGKALSEALSVILDESVRTRLGNAGIVRAAQFSPEHVVGQYRSLCAAQE